MYRFLSVGVENFKYGAELPASKEVKSLVNKDQGLGVVILIASILGILIYGGLVFFAGFVISVWVLRITAFIAVAGVFSHTAWIGYTLATTPPPQPIEELEKELQTSTSTQTPSTDTSTATPETPTQQAAQPAEQAASSQRAQTMTQRQRNRNPSQEQRKPSNHQKSVRH